MSYLEFRNQFLQQACFNANQVYAWHPDFDRNNFSRWIKRGLLVRLRQGFYTFPEYKGKSDYELFFANRIYRPSYISLQTALAFYGIIPEAVVHITSVTSIKTETFSNDFGVYSYKNVRNDLFFGYDLKAFSDSRSLQIASPEKAILDLLYLYPFYNNWQEVEELRFDENFMNEDLNKDLLYEFSNKFKSKALEKRLRILKAVYQL